MTQTPIACTLNATERADRGDEWRAFFNANVVEVIRTDTLARLRLKDGDDVIVAAVDLSRREKYCCAFFDFHFEILPDAVWLEVGAPDEAVEMIDALLSS